MTTTRTTTRARARRAPQRTCVACRRVGDQSSFVRVARVPAGPDSSESRVVVDEGRRRLAGRGAYLCRQASCWERGIKGALAGGLRGPLNESDREGLRAYASRFSSTESNDGDAPGAGPQEGEGE